MKNEEPIFKFFEIAGNSRDSEIFLKNFQSQSPEKFAIIYAETEALSNSFLSFLHDLKFLYSLNLYPSVVIEKKSEDYLKLFYQNIYTSLHSPGKFDLFPFELIQASQKTPELIQKKISAKKIPFVIFDSGEIHYLNFIGSLASDISTNKIMILREQSGLKEIQKNQNISIINMETDYSKLVQENVLSEKDRELFLNAKTILDNSTNPKLSIAVTSPISLLKELFTIKGSGTYIKKGSKIQILNSYKEVDSKKLKDLFERAFRKKIQEDFFQKKVKKIFLESDYRGAAIFLETKFGILLSKFAVDEIARGEGVGRDIWDKMKSEFDVIIWRANPNNSINGLYKKECDGFQKFPNWNIYWIGLKPEKIQEVCEFLSTEKSDFFEI